MSLNDPFFTKFDGSPDVGRVPTRLIVLGGGELSESQLRGVDHVYGQFRNACKLSASDFHTEQVKLQDGTIVHMWSLQGRDEVTVTPGDAAEEDRLPHGFAVVTNWQSATIYKRVISGPVGPTYPYWEFAGDYVPQVEAGKTIFDNQAFRVADPGAAEKDYFNLPMVYNRNDAVLWDYGLRAGLASASVSDTTPFVLKNSTTGKFDFEAPHYGDGDKILDDAGAVLYTVPATPNILAPAAEGYPDEPHYFPAQTDAEGNQLAMSHWRYAVISPTFNIWKFRLCNERIQRTGDATYEAMERNVQDITTPFGPQTVTTLSVSDADLGESVEDLLFLVQITIAGFGGGGTLTPPGATFYWLTGWGELARDITGRRYGAAPSATRQIVTQAAGAATASKIIAAGAHDAVEYIDLLQELNYPADIFWRGGTAERGFYPSDFLGDSFSLPGYGVREATIWRKDTKYHVDGTPKITAKLGWFDLLLLDGSTTGRMDGSVYEDEKTVFGRIEGTDRDFVTRETFSPYSYDPDYVPTSERYDWYTAHNIRWGRVEELRVQYTPATVYTLVENVRPANTGSYSLTSRYVIDYDHKGRFYAAIRCEVVCSGAEWEENVAVYEGFMQVKTNPSYAVKIWFESHWNGVDAQLLLVEESITRPAFEFIAIEKLSPWYWAVPAYIDRSCIVRVPPEPKPDENFMMMFKNLASHQGANTNLCCADVRPDITGAEIAKTQSQDGIEYSYLLGGEVFPHEKYVTGQLYARTFKLSDLGESLWLLHQLKVSAIEGDFQAPEPAPIKPAWFYHPLIKAALDVTRHIEVRDGVIGNWSDNLEGVVSGYPPTPAEPPAANSRDIKLYRV